jgi:hypothetical protein
VPNIAQATGDKVGVGVAHGRLLGRAIYISLKGEIFVSQQRVNGERYIRIALEET